MYHDSQGGGGGGGGGGGVVADDVVAAVVTVVGWRSRERIATSHCSGSTVWDALETCSGQMILHHRKSNLSILEGWMVSL